MVRRNMNSDDEFHQWILEMRSKGYTFPFEDQDAAGDDLDPADMLTTLLGPGIKKRITHIDVVPRVDKADHSMIFYNTDYESEDSILISRLHRSDRITGDTRIGPYIYTWIDTLEVSNLEMAKLLSGALKETYAALQDKILLTGITPQHGVVVDNTNGKFNSNRKESSIALRVTRLGSEKKPYFSGRLYRKMAGACSGDLLLLPSYYVDAFIEMTRRQLKGTEYSSVRQPASLLQHSCNTIRSHTDSIDELPLPKRLKAYVESDV